MSDAGGWFGGLDSVGQKADSSRQGQKAGNNRPGNLGQVLARPPRLPCGALMEARLSFRCSGMETIILFLAKIKQCISKNVLLKLAVNGMQRISHYSGGISSHR